MAYHKIVISKKFLRDLTCRIEIQVTPLLHKGDEFSFNRWFKNNEFEVEEMHKIFCALVVGNVMYA